MAIACSGCSHLPLATPLPEGVTVTRIGDQLPDSPFAVSPDGRYVALASQGLRLVESATGNSRQLRTDSPTALAWSPTGSRLSAAFPDAGGSLLAIFSPADGRQPVESRVNAVVTSVTWLNDRDVAAGGLVLKPFTFGTNATTVLYRWDGDAPPVATTLRDTTLRPATAQKFVGELVRPGKFGFSPSADEVLFLHPHDPPMFTPYYKVILRNLTNSAERELPGVSLGGVVPVFAADGERVSYGDAYTQWYDPWQATPLTALPAGGKALAVSPGGEYLLIDGTLYRNGVAVLAVNGTVAGRFSADGRSLFLASEGSLYRIDGLRDAPPPQLTPDQAKRLLELRAWRTEGLITPAEYRAAKERTLRP